MWLHNSALICLLCFASGLLWIHDLLVSAPIPPTLGWVNFSKLFQCDGAEWLALAWLPWSPPRQCCLSYYRSFHLYGTQFLLSTLLNHWNWRQLLMKNCRYLQCYSYRPTTSLYRSKSNSRVPDSSEPWKSKVPSVLCKNLNFFVIILKRKKCSQGTSRPCYSTALFHDVVCLFFHFSTLIL